MTGWFGAPCPGKFCSEETRVDNVDNNGPPTQGMPIMRMNTTDLNQITGYRYGFMIADMVLGDTLTEFADGSIDEDELEIAIQQHRVAYEGYVRKLHEYLKPVAEA